MKTAFLPGVVSFIMLSAILFATPQMAAAATTNFAASIDGSQEVPPNASTATGTGAFQYDDTTDMLSFDIEFSGLSSAETGAHFHGPAAPGTNAAIIFTLPPGSPKVGSVGPLSASQESDLFSGLWYVNIHSTNFPGGEIRGQLFIPSYDLNLFEGSDPSDGTVELNQEVKAVAETDDPSVDNVIFRWINPDGIVVEETTVAPSSGSAFDTFTPDMLGDWTVEADFGNGIVVRQTMSVPFFVIPESPIGIIGLIASSVAAFGAFMVLRKRSSKNNASDRFAGLGI